MEKHLIEIGNHIINKIKEAIKKHGLYTYQDKGAWETISSDDLNKMVETLNQLPPNEIAEVLTYVSKVHKNGDLTVYALAHEIIELHIDDFNYVDIIFNGVPPDIQSYL